MTKVNFKKLNLINIISRKTGFSKNFSKKLIDDILQIVSLKISRGDTNLKNLGTFKILNKKKRIGRNPKTKEEKKISERKVVLFKPSKEFKEFINIKTDE